MKLDYESSAEVPRRTMPEVVRAAIALLVGLAAMGIFLMVFFACCSTGSWVAIVAGGLLVVGAGYAIFRMVWDLVRVR